MSRICCKAANELLHCSLLVQDEMPDLKSKMVQLEDLLKPTALRRFHTKRCSYSKDLHRSSLSIGQVPNKSTGETHNPLLSVPLWDDVGYLRFRHGMAFMFDVGHIKFMSLRHTKQILLFMCHWTNLALISAYPKPLHFLQGTHRTLRLNECLPSGPNLEAWVLKATLMELSYCWNPRDSLGWRVERSWNGHEHMDCKIMTMQCDFRWDGWLVKTEKENWSAFKSPDAHW